MISIYDYDFQIASNEEKVLKLKVQFIQTASLQYLWEN